MKSVTYLLLSLLLSIVLGTLVVSAYKYATYSNPQETVQTITVIPEVTHIENIPISKKVIDIKKLDRATKSVKNMLTNIQKDYKEK